MRVKYAGKKVNKEQKIADRSGRFRVVWRCFTTNRKMPSSFKLSTDWKQDAVSEREGEKRDLLEETHEASWRKKEDEEEAGGQQKLRET